MRGLRRHEQEPGLDEERRRLIHSYMDDLDEPDEVAQPVAVAEQAPLPEQPEVVELARAAPAAPVVPPAVEVDHRDLAPIVRLPPPPQPSPPRRDAVDASRRTLQQVARLCEQIEWARSQGERRRVQLAASAARQRTIPPGSLPAE